MLIINDNNLSKLITEKVTQILFPTEDDNNKFIFCLYGLLKVYVNKYSGSH